MEFAITGCKGFHIIFKNGVTVSVQFGGGNYCENYDEEIGGERNKKKLTSGDAEVAVWDKEGKWITPSDDGDMVIGYQTPADVLRIMNWASELENVEEVD